MFLIVVVLWPRLVLFLHESEYLVTVWYHTIKSPWQIELHIF